MKNTILLFFTLLFFCNGLFAQPGPFDQLVDFNYRNIRLEDALIDVTVLYEINFAYSKNYIPVDERISVRVQGVPFRIGLDSLLAEVPVTYQLVGSQVVLKYDGKKPIRRKNRQLGMRNRSSSLQKDRSATTSSNRHDIEGDNSFYDWQNEKVNNNKNVESVPPTDDLTELRELEQALEKESIAAAGKNKFKRNINRRPTRRTIEQQPVAWSVLPFIGNHGYRSDEFTNRWSFNVLWGYNGGVNGLEVGLLGNSIEGDVKGLQLAGIGNTVSGNVDAGQWGGVFNFVSGTTKGLQLAGVLNSTRVLNGFQGAGVLNLAYEYADGVQIGGLGNVLLGVSDAFQFGGVFNVNAGRSFLQTAGVINYAPEVSVGQVAGFANVADQIDGVQLAGVINVAEEVRGLQLASLVNVAGKVRGSQIGVLNICDSISGMPIGLLNFVQHGYNRFELSGEEALYLNAGVKLGGHRFYNILQTGFRFDEGGTAPTAGRTEELSWALGYGLGMVIPVNQRWHFNLEAVSSHVNEGELWTNELNLLNQLRFTADVDWSGTHFFIGPTFNIMLSKLYDADNQSYGTSIAPYTLYDQTSSSSDPLNTKMWLGFQAGFRW